MSGHSKWSTIKHKKAATDAAPRQAVHQAAQGDHRRGPHGRRRPQGRTPACAPPSWKRGPTACRATTSTAPSRRAPASWRPRSTKRSSTRATGPAGVAILVEAATDNRNRTARRDPPPVHTGTAAAWARPAAWPGCSTAAATSPSTRSAMDEEKLMELALELGVDDVADRGGASTRSTRPWRTSCAIQEELERRGVPSSAKELAMIPQTTIDVPGRKGRTRCCASRSPGGPRRRPEGLGQPPHRREGAGGPVPLVLILGLDPGQPPHRLRPDREARLLARRPRGAGRFSCPKTSPCPARLAHLAGRLDELVDLAGDRTSPCWRPPSMA